MNYFLGTTWIMAKKLKHTCYRIFTSQRYNLNDYYQQKINVLDGGLNNAKRVVKKRLFCEKNDILDIE